VKVSGVERIGGKSCVVCNALSFTPVLRDVIPFGGSQGTRTSSSGGRSSGRGDDGLMELSILDDGHETVKKGGTTYDISGMFPSRGSRHGGNHGYGIFDQL